MTGYFIICTGENNRQVMAIADEVEATLKDAGLPAIGREGLEEGKWVLLDFADVVVHIFQPEERGFYRLEHLWQDAPRLELAPEVENATVGQTYGEEAGAVSAEIHADDVS